MNEYIYRDQQQQNRIEIWIFFFCNSTIRIDNDDDRVMSENELNIENGRINRKIFSVLCLFVCLDEQMLMVNEHRSF